MAYAHYVRYRTERSCRVALYSPNLVISPSSPIQTIGYPLNTNIKLGSANARSLQLIPIINRIVEKIVPLNHFLFLTFFMGVLIAWSVPSFSQQTIPTATSVQI